MSHHTKGRFRPFSASKKSIGWHYTLFLPMSNPLSRFGNLDINDMAETRSQRGRGQRGARRATSGRGRGRGGTAGQPPATPVTPIRGHSGALYNIQNLSPDSNRRAAEGLAAGLYVDELYSHEREDRSDAWFAFQLKKPVSVRIFNPAFGANRVECSCGLSNESTCCIHLYVCTVPIHFCDSY